MLNDILDPNKNSLLEARGSGASGRFFGSFEMYFVLGTIAFLVAILFFWAAYIRKPNRRSRSSHSRSSKLAKSSSEPLSSDRKRKRHRRWKNRNPTLSQIGGLPPPKSDPSPQQSD